MAKKPACARHHYRQLVRQEIPALATDGTSAMGHHPGRAKRHGVRDQVARHSVARTCRHYRRAAPD
ncbi:hypothetical protein, partial [Bacillus subtilis]|uniref:hypothetical protein n=1 Tax=Bacillus subtilis TaxID=1423 RepID=UPI003C30B2E5